MAQKPDLLSQAGRTEVLKDINQEENRSRKREHQKRFDVFNERQDVYILERLRREFSIKTVNEMRKVLSINLTTRIINEMSSIYNNSPERSFVNPNRELNDDELMQLEALYDDCKVNQVLRKANQFYNLHDQSSLMIVPDLMGGFKMKALPPHYYDVIPDPVNPELAYAYILNVWDFDLYKSVRSGDAEPTQLNRYRMNDRLNQSVADDNDREALLQRYVVWTPEFHYTMDGKGNLKTEVMPNPIGRLPFVDIATDKDFQFFVRRGTSVVDFALDFGLLLSDLSNIIRMQGYSQAVISSTKKPEDSRVGPTHIMWLKQDPNATVQPNFQFVSPNPDIQGSLEFLETTLRLFLSSRGIDPATISGKGEARSFSSGVERLLAMLDKFEATRSDYDLFKNVEYEVFDILKLWSNAFQGVVGEGQLKEELRLSELSDEIEMNVKFNQPTSVQTQSEKEESVIRLLEAGLMSEIEAIQELREVDEDKAKQIMDDIRRGIMDGSSENNEEENTADN